MSEVIKRAITYGAISALRHEGHPIRDLQDDFLNRLYSEFCEEERNGQGN